MEMIAPLFKGKAPLFKGKAPLIEGKPAFSSGKAPLLKGKPAFSTAEAPLLKGRPAFSTAEAPLCTGAAPLLKMPPPLLPAMRPPATGSARLSAAPAGKDGGAAPFLAAPAPSLAADNRLRKRNRCPAKARRPIASLRRSPALFPPSKSQMTRPLLKAGGCFESMKPSSRSFIAGLALAALARLGGAAGKSPPRGPFARLRLLPFPCQGAQPLEGSPPCRCAATFFPPAPPAPPVGRR